jgi:hypothetical protein
MASYVKDRKWLVQVWGRKIRTGYLMPATWKIISKEIISKEHRCQLLLLSTKDGKY